MKNTENGKIDQLKGKIQKQWGKITDDDFQKAKGDMTYIKGKIKEKYNLAQKEVEEKVSEL